MRQMYITTLHSFIHLWHSQSMTVLAISQVSNNNIAEGEKDWKPRKKNKKDRQQEPKCRALKVEIWVACQACRCLDAGLWIDH